jgi:hypothetical protein
MYTQQQAISNQPDSTETKKLKKLQDRTIQQQACKELLKLRDVIGGFSYGAFKTIIDKYKSKGFVCVTRRNLWYRIGLLQNHNGLMVSESSLPLKDIFTIPLAFDEISPVIDNSNTTSVSKTIPKNTISKKGHIPLVNGCISKVALLVAGVKNDASVLTKNYLQ